MTPPDHIKRLACSRCLRPQRSCICGWITPLEPAVEVLILQHPLEVANAKNSARLLQLSLTGSRLVVGEIFEEQALRALLDASAARHSILLYPESPDDKGLGLATPPALDQALLNAPAQLRLVVLDGTWRKSRKMLYLNPLLQQLPRLSLHNPPASRYLIRKAHGPGQLSTLEATCHALMQLEQDESKYQSLLTAFNGFVAQQAVYRQY
ncbi:tRNA-uridine aminocarboxypropyltransferase [Collimonas sp. OK412]|jgi:DTW domain-containing protein YfiP|uniref:tRNA-uridine aminocarboxypropyltransferase n=1 Tax=Collimonas sp. (strain OK412) TaxID=1801619 RepID=UPI0008EA3227|nr:tRNA-uridine aminocarboxypropyltransferase [Collimonas sp. OK412]SFD18544.1 DTW domain-containing protein YfiP [Collimonas sp. OK412]